MEVKALKEAIYHKETIPVILEELGCHHIIKKQNYYSCANPDGDNPNAVIIYNNENLNGFNYTRTIKPQDHSIDIFDLIQYYRSCSFFQALHFTCQCSGLNYYTDTSMSNMCYSQYLMKSNKFFNKNATTRSHIQPIDESVLRYYESYPNAQFLMDNISIETQKKYEIGYDPTSTYITIPIRDEIGSLIGIKGRRLEFNCIDDTRSKYTHIEKGQQSQILYGLHHNWKKIKENCSIYVFESEKSVMQADTEGIYNTCALGGSHVSNTQISKLLNLNVEIIFCFDTDIHPEYIQTILQKFSPKKNVYYAYDYHQLYDNKMSPTDAMFLFSSHVETIYDVHGNPISNKRSI